MAEIKIKGDKFFVLKAGAEKWIYDTESTAIESMKSLVSEKKNLSPEDVSILEVNVKGEKWEIKPVPWSKIAMGLIRKG